MNDQFPFDVFLTNSAKDKRLTRSLLEWLRNDELKIWFDEYLFKPGSNSPAKIEKRKEYSFIPIFCMSANAFGSDWGQLKPITFWFSDPWNSEHCFIPLWLDDVPNKIHLTNQTI